MRDKTTIILEDAYDQMHKQAYNAALQQALAHNQMKTQQNLSKKQLVPMISPTGKTINMELGDVQDALQAGFKMVNPQPQQPQQHPQQPSTSKFDGMYGFPLSVEGWKIFFKNNPTPQAQLQFLSQLQQSINNS
jgi:hypothetical protein